MWARELRGSATVRARNSDGPRQSAPRWNSALVDGSGARTGGVDVGLGPTDQTAGERWAVAAGAQNGRGPRVSDLTGLTVADVDRRGEQALLRITAGAKGGKHRIVPLPTSTVASVDAYLAERARGR